MKSRIPCINPACRRTAPAEKYEAGTEIICGKCFRALPAEIRNDNRHCWREYRKWDRRIKRTSDELKLPKMQSIRDLWSARIDQNWAAIQASIASPEKPEGLDAILEELGL